MPAAAAAGALTSFRGEAGTTGVDIPPGLPAPFWGAAVPLRPAVAARCWRRWRATRPPPERAGVLKSATVSMAFLRMTRDL